MQRGTPACSATARGRPSTCAPHKSKYSPQRSPVGSCCPSPVEPVRVPVSAPLFVPFSEPLSVPFHTSLILWGASAGGGIVSSTEKKTVLQVSRSAISLYISSYDLHTAWHVCRDASIPVLGHVRKADRKCTSGKHACTSSIQK